MWCSCGGATWFSLVQLPSIWWVVHQLPYILRVINLIDILCWATKWHKMPFSLSIIFIPFRGKLLVFINYFKNYQKITAVTRTKYVLWYVSEGIWGPYYLGIVLSGDSFTKEYPQHGFTFKDKIWLEKDIAENLSPKSKKKSVIFDRKLIRI